MNSSWVFAVGEKDFEAQVLKKSHEVPVVVDFWSPSCGPCRILAPVLERQVEARKGAVLLAKVNTDEEPGLAMHFGVESIPLVVAIRGGKIVDEFVGALPEAQIAAFLDRIGPTDAERKSQEASKLEKTDATQAEKIYRQALQKDANNEAAILGLARILIAQDKDSEAAELLQNV